MSLIHEQDEFAAQSENLSAGVLTGIVTGTATIVVIIVVIAVSISGLRFEEARVEAIAHTGYPNLRQTQVDSQQKLTRYEILDRDAGVYRIPIEHAMSLIIEEAAATSSGSSELRLER